jgi:hypothetical protein
VTNTNILIGTETAPVFPSRMDHHMRAVVPRRVGSRRPPGRPPGHLCRSGRSAVGLPVKDFHAQDEIQYLVCLGGNRISMRHSRGSSVERRCRLWECMKQVAPRALLIKLQIAPSPCSGLAHRLFHFVAELRTDLTLIACFGDFYELI